MSFYTFAATNLTTAADIKRRPRINQAQIMRTLVLCLLFAAALGLMARHGHATVTASDSGSRGFVEGS